MNELYLFMQSTIFFLISLIICFSANAQIEFTENIVIDSSLRIQSPKAGFPADLDGDGDMDILASSSLGDELVWFENLNGTGTHFVKHVISSAIDNPWGVYAADLDGDGDWDVLATSLTANQIIWYENTNGLGDFVQKQVISAYKVDFVKAADIDGDNDLDIIWSSRQDGKIKYTKNTDGLGTFVGTYNIENNVSSIPNFQLADVDGDGAIDIVSSWSTQGGSQGVSWYKNPNGSGPFGSRMVISNSVSGVTSVYAGDLDGDNDIDVAVSLAGDGKIVWFENIDGQGTFGPEQVLSNTAIGAFQVSLADFDNDGDLDVIAALNGDEEGKLIWFKNLDGAGEFGDEIFISSYLDTMRSLEVEDVDGDGDLDFVTATDNDNNIKWYSNTDGEGAFSEYTITKNIMGGKVIFASDLDGDGDLDLLSASHWDDKIAWYENKDGHGNYTDTQKIISEIINGASSVVAADLDGDGDNDVIATSSLDNYVVWFKNTDGQANFGEAILLDENLYNATKAYVADIDNDGDMDVICIAGGKIVWYDNLDGNGTFGQRQPIESINNYYINSIDFGDLDGDGDLDISAASTYGLLYYLNLDGQGNFGSRQVLADPNHKGVATKIADIDGDGVNDIVFAVENAIADYVGWYRNTNGLANFDAVQIITTIISDPKDLLVFDVDNDGDMDVISSSYQGSGIIAWYENADGQGDFNNSQQIISTITGSPFQFTLFNADINQDNNMDIVSINDLDDQILWFGNTQPIFTNEIKGTVRFDLLGDGCTVEDQLISGLMIIAEGSTNSRAAFTQENGSFRLFMNEDGVVNTQITSQLPTYYQSNPAVFQSNFNDYGNVDTVNFCIEPVSAINDLNISAYPLFGAPRPGFNTFYRIVYRNVGTTQLTGSVTFNFNGSKLSFVNASLPASSQTANSIFFDFEDLNPFEKRTIDLEFNVFPPPTTNIDEVLTTSVSIEPITGDYTEEDNFFSFEEIVVGSYDPNDIMVLQGDQIVIEDAHKYLNYIIRFQNTGTASAINVRVAHVLDDKLDWKSLQLESLSHSGTVKITDQTDVEFIFENINLPDSSTDEPGSHGYIAFKIKPKTDVAINDIISGVANIYFDFNPPIITNTVTTKIVESLGMNDLIFNNLVLYPNPGKDIIQIASKIKIESIYVFDIKGRLLRSIKVSNNSYNLDIANLSTGIYFVEIISGGQKLVKKIAKH